MLFTHEPQMGSVWGSIKGAASSALDTVVDATVAIHAAPLKAAGRILGVGVSAVAPGVEQAFAVAGSGLQQIRPPSAALPPPSSSSNLPIYLGAGAAAVVLLLLATRKRKAPEASS